MHNFSGLSTLSLLSSSSDAGPRLDLGLHFCLFFPFSMDFNFLLYGLSCLTFSLNCFFSYFFLAYSRHFTPVAALGNNSWFLFFLAFTLLFCNTWLENIFLKGLNSKRRCFKLLSWGQFIWRSWQNIVCVIASLGD